MNARSRLGPILYGALFTIVLPVLLLLWAAATEPRVGLPALHVPWLGGLLMAFGFALCGTGMLALRRHGEGLPMNAYPPPLYVTQSVYRFVSHPIYLGFAFVCVGAALSVGSASGLWLVSPMASLGAAALVLGYERHDLRRRFGPEAVHRPVLSLPPGSEGRPTVWDRISIVVLVIVPWIIAYEAVFQLGIPPDAVEGFFAFEREWPVWVWTEIAYASVYILVGIVPFVAKSTRTLRHFALTGLVASGVVTLIYLTVPVVAPPRAFVSDSLLGRMLDLERAMSNTVAAFPAFHVIWTLIAAEALVRTYPRASAAVWLWALAIAVSCITTGMHALVDVVFAGPLFLLLRSYARVWEVMRSGAETVANSWREWHFGPVRLINHGFYAGAGAGVGLWVALALSGSEARTTTVALFASGLLGAGLWAQRLEGSSALSRPFGYFGSVVGVFAAGLLLLFAGLPVATSLGATAVAAPWMQAIGRLRCLVQGCCHGANAPDGIGINYRVPNSRVIALADLGDRPLHPTPLYSILSNVVIGILLARLWQIGAALTMIGGVYLLLSGVARFVEESYRGEPQTAVVRGLRLYQWTAIALVVGGMALSSLPSAPAPDGSAWFGAGTLITALTFGVASLVAMGVDFPDSRRRYARLSG